MRQKRRALYRYLRRRFGHEALLRRMLLGSAIFIWRFLPKDGSPAQRIHDHFCREAWRDAAWTTRLALILGYFLSIPFTLAQACYYTASLGPNIKKLSGKGLARQAFEQCTLGLFRSLPPRWYYIFELHDDTKARQALHYIYRFEIKMFLYGYLRRRLEATAESIQTLSNKITFGEFCKRHNVPAIPNMGLVTARRIRLLDSGEVGVPKKDIFLKPLIGAGGRGAETWYLREDGDFESHRGRVLNRQELAAHVMALGRQRPHVLRLAVRNHSELADLSPGALCTVRILCCQDEAGHPVITNAVFRMPRRAETAVDNFSAGGIAANVDLEKGTLGPATDFGLMPDSRWWSDHPTTGARIEGRQLPYWRETLDLAHRVQALFPDHVALGWDIAILNDGPQLVEGNKSPGLDSYQRLSGAPLGNARFGELLAFHLDRASHR